MQKMLAAAIGYDPNFRPISSRGILATTRCFSLPRAVSMAFRTAGGRILQKPPNMIMLHLDKLNVKRPAKRVDLLASQSQEKKFRKL